jgi:DNA repair exonuclease SbcCD ATPase subunit
MVRVKFKVKDQSWEVVRARKHSDHGNFLRWWIDGVEMTKDSALATKKELADNLPISHTVFRHAVQVGQGMPDRFLSLSETQKQDLLCEILDLNIYDDALQTVNNILRQLEPDIIFQQDNKTRAEEAAKAAYNSVFCNTTDLTEIKKSISSKRGQVQPLLEEKELIESGISKKEEKIQQARSEYQSKSERIGVLNDMARTKRSRADSSIKEAREKARENLSGWEAAEAQIKNNYDEAAHKLSLEKMRVGHLKGRVDEVKNTPSTCPTCNQPLSNRDGIEAKLKEAQEESNKAVEDMAEVERSYKSYEKAKEEFSIKMEEAKGIWDKYVEDVTKVANDGLKEDDEVSTSLGKEATVLFGEMNRLEEELRQEKGRHRAILDLIDGRNRTIKEEEVEQARIEERLAIAKRSLEESNKEVETASGKVEELIKTQTHWKYWKESIPNLRAAAMEQVLTFLNERIGVYMSEFSSGVMGMDFYQIPHGKKSKIKTNLRTPGGTYELSSGGERRRIDLSVYLALSDLLHVASGISCNVLVADEIMDGLSPVGVQKFSEILRKKADNGMCIFVVSHNSNVRDIVEYDSVLIVERKDDRATLKSRECLVK